MVCGYTRQVDAWPFQREYSNKSDIFGQIVARNIFFSDICNPNRRPRVFQGRNSSAV